MGAPQARIPSTEAMKIAQVKSLIVWLLTGPGLWYAGVRYEKRTAGSAPSAEDRNANIRSPRRGGTETRLPR